MSDPNEKKRILLLYLGFTELSNRKPGTIWFEITEKEKAEQRVDLIHVYNSRRKIDRVHIFSMKGTKTDMPATPGMIYAVDIEGSSIFPKTAKYIGKWSDNDMCATLDALSRKERLVFDARRHKKLKSKASDLEHYIEPLREAYFDSGPHKSIFLAHVVELITKRQL